MKALAVRALNLPGLRSGLRWLQRGQACIFMLHRFSDPELGVTGQDPEELRSALQLLRDEGYGFIALGDLVRRFSEGRPAPDRSVCFTLDDGYSDQARIGAPIFAEFDCPVTTFVCTGFADGQFWMWWDRVEYIFDNTRKKSIDVEIGGRRLQATWTDEPELQAARYGFVAACKLVPDAEKNGAIDRLAEDAEVELPAAAPPEYAAMSWSELRQSEKLGMTFGPHTLTHPILSRTTDDAVRLEIEGSRDRLAEKAENPLPVFCYPNGQRGDFGQRELDILRALEFDGAVVGYTGYASLRDFESEPEARYLIRRFGLPSDRLDLIQCSSGIERLKSLLRRES